MRWQTSDSPIRWYVKYELMWFPQKMLKKWSLGRSPSVWRLARVTRSGQQLTRRMGFPFWTHWTEPPGVRPTEQGMLMRSPGLTILVMAPESPPLADELLNPLLTLSPFRLLSTKPIIKHNKNISLNELIWLMTAMQCLWNHYQWMFNIVSDYVRSDSLRFAQTCIDFHRLAILFLFALTSLNNCIVSLIRYYFSAHSSHRIDRRDFNGW